MRVRNKFLAPSVKPEAGTPILTQAELEAQQQHEQEQEAERLRLEAEQNTRNQSPPAPSIDPDYVKRLEDSVRESNQRMARLEEALLSRPVNNPPAPVVDPEKEKAEYFENPAAYTEKKLQQRLDETIKPINDFISEFRGSSRMEAAIAEVKESVEFKNQWDADVEQAVRQQLSTVNPAQINRNIVSHAAVNAIGLKAMGKIGRSTPAPSSNNNPVPNTPPPNVRPSNPPAPNHRPTNAEPVVTENERVMARANGQTIKEFVFWRDVPEDKVMNAKWDKAKQTGTY